MLDYDTIDSTEWLDTSDNWLNYDTDLFICDILPVNDGCTDMHHQITLASGDKINLIRSTEV